MGDIYVASLSLPERLLIVEWKFFLGACFLTGALLVPHAGIVPVAKGIGLAALILWLRSRSRSGPGPSA